MGSRSQGGQALGAQPQDPKVGLAGRGVAAGAPPQVSVLVEAGWPRPVVNGWPVPWVADASDVPATLNRMPEDRFVELIERMACQVCGLGHDEGGAAYVMVNEPEPPADPRGKVLLAMDNAVLHERCWRLAAARCPALAREREAGALLAYRVAVADLGVYYDEAPDSQDPAAPRWGAPLNRCELVA